MTNNNRAEADQQEWFDIRKKPVVVEARGPYHNPAVVETIEGEFEVDESYVDEHGGFYVIRGVEGELYPCAVDIFRNTYEVVEDE